MIVLSILGVIGLAAMCLLFAKVKEMYDWGYSWSYSFLHALGGLR